MADVALVIDDEARRVLVQALDLLQRVAMGQWRAISEHAPNVIGPTSPAGFEQLAHDLMVVRRRNASDAALRLHDGASLGIRGTHREAQVACDIWHALGGGMESRQGDRLTNVRVHVEEVRDGVS